MLIVLSKVVFHQRARVIWKVKALSQTITKGKPKFGICILIKNYKIGRNCVKMVILR